MKTRISKKFLNNYEIRLSCGYDELQYLLSCETPRYYNAGVDGWNFDTYTFFVETKDGIKSVALSTGYRNTQGTWIDYTTTQKYEKKAAKIRKTLKTYNGIKNALYRLIEQLINETIELK